MVPPHARADRGTGTSQISGLWTTRAAVGSGRGTTAPPRPDRPTSARAPGRDRPDDRGLRRRLLDIVAAVVPHDFYAFVLTDPQTAVGTSPLARGPGPRGPARASSGSSTSPARAVDGPRHRAARPCSLPAGGDLGRSQQWAGALRQHGVTDVLLAVLQDRHGTWGFLDLWRVTGAFDDAEVAAVAAALAHR